MPGAAPQPHAFRTTSPEIDARIQQLVKDLATPFQQQLLAEMITAVYKLGEDKASTIDLKIITTTIKELRYAFKVFHPYNEIRKVAVFGSARTPRRHPHYELAKHFARLMVDAGWMVITGAASGIMGAGQEGAGSAGSFVMVLTKTSSSYCCSMGRRHSSRSPLVKMQSAAST